MGKEIMVDEYGCEITKEEAEETRLHTKPWMQSMGRLKRSQGDLRSQIVQSYMNPQSQNLRTAAVSSKELHPAAAVR